MVEIYLPRGFRKAVIGAQWGDEGKGKIVDEEAESADAIVRFGGGSNAGHTVENNVFHLMPSGALHPNKRLYLGNNTVIYTPVLIEEIKRLEHMGINPDLRVSDKAHIAFGYHLHRDILQEKRRGNRAIGTTKQGIGPAYEDKIKRIGIRAGQLRNPERVLNNVDYVLRDYRRGISRNRIPEWLKTETYEDEILTACREIGPRVVNMHQSMKEEIDKNSEVLLEGAQGTMLSINDGTYENVTSSDTTAAGALIGSDLPPGLLNKVILIYKAYTSRVGSGGMPTEMYSELAAILRKVAGEYGATTGRPRRLGYWDGVSARYAAELNLAPITEAAITRGDVMTGLGRFKIGRAYRAPNGEILDVFETDDFILQQLEAIYDENEYYEWEQDFTGVDRWDDLPEEYQNYLVALESTLPESVKITRIGTGPRRGHVVKLPHSPKELTASRKY